MNDQGIHTLNKIDKSRIGTILVTGETNTDIARFYSVADSRHTTMGSAGTSHYNAILLPDLVGLFGVEFNDVDVDATLKDFIDAVFAKYHVGETGDRRKHVIAIWTCQVKFSTAGPEDSGQFYRMIWM